jgi:Mg-chelatase subunit ChlD
MSTYELNRGDNFIFGVDVSGSMQTTDAPGGLSRIDYLKEKVITFAVEASRYDPDGIDVLTFGHATTPFLRVTGARAREIIQALRANEATTNTHSLIREAFRLHNQGSHRQTVLFVATDGQPSNPSAVKEEILAIAKAIKHPREFSISFLTVGVIEPGLRLFLTELDDALASCEVPDIVDVKALEDVDFERAFMGALHD